jgi:hypothetical protein
MNDGEKAGDRSSELAGPAIAHEFDTDESPGGRPTPAPTPTLGHFPEHDPLIDVEANATDSGGAPCADSRAVSSVRQAELARQFLLPPAPEARAALPPGRAGSPPGGRRGEGLAVAVEYPGPNGPWVGHNELGDAAHTMAALRALEAEGAYDGKINVLSEGRGDAARMVDLFSRVFPQSTVVVHTPPAHTGPAGRQTFFRSVKAHRADQPALGHPFDATRVLGQQQVSQPETMPRVRQFVDGLATTQEKAGVKQYLASVDASLLDAGVPKAIVALRGSTDGYGRSRNSSQESLVQMTDALAQRGLQVVVMGSPLPDMQLPAGTVDLTGHWRRVSDLPAQAHLFDQLAQHDTRVAVGNMSGILDLVHLSADIPVVEFGPGFRMKMWEDAFGEDQFAVIEPEGYDATSADPAQRRFDESAMQRLGQLLDDMVEGRLPPSVL